MFSEKKLHKNIKGGTKGSFLEIFIKKDFHKIYINIYKYIGFRPTFAFLVCSENLMMRLLSFFYYFWTGIGAGTGVGQAVT